MACTLKEEDEEVANMRRIKRWTVMGMSWVLLGRLAVVREAPLGRGRDRGHRFHRLPEDLWGERLGPGLCRGRSLG